MPYQREGFGYLPNSMYAQKTGEAGYYAHDNRYVSLYVNIKIYFKLLFFFLQTKFSWRPLGN